MGNRFRGKITAAVDGQEYTLVLDFNAMAEFEDRTGKNAMDVLQGMEKGNGSASDMRALVYACLLTYQPDATLQVAGDIMSEEPGVIARLVMAAMPDAAAAGSAGGNVRARKTARA